MVVYWIGRMKPTREVANLILFKNGPPQPLLSFIFGLFKQTSLQFLQQIYMKKCQSSIRCWDSNPQPSMHESPTMTTRPGLPPTVVSFLSGHFRPQFHYFRHFEAMQLVEEWRYGMRTADRLY